MNKDDFSPNNPDLAGENLSMEERKAKPYYRYWRFLTGEEKVYRYTEEEGLKWTALWAECRRVVSRLKDLDFKLNSENPRYGICPNCQTVLAEKPERLSPDEFCKDVTPCKVCGYDFCTFCSAKVVDMKYTCQCQPLYTFPLIERQCNISQEMWDMEKEWRQDCRKHHV